LGTNSFGRSLSQKNFEIIQNTIVKILKASSARKIANNPDDFLKIERVTPIKHDNLNKENSSKEMYNNGY